MGQWGGWEDLGGSGGGQAVIRIYYMKMICFGEKERNWSLKTNKDIGYKKARKQQSCGKY